MLLTRRVPLHRAPALLFQARGFMHKRDRGAGRAWTNGGKGPRFAKDGEDFPTQVVQPQRTNRRVNFVPKFVKKSSSAWIFQDRFPNAVLRRVAKNQNKSWALTEEEYHAIKQGDYTVPMRDRKLSPVNLIKCLRQEEILKMKKLYPRVIPDFGAGDKISITKYLGELGNGDNKLETIKGMCIGRQNRLNESTFSILNNKDDTTWEMKIPLWSPFVKEIKVLQKGTLRTRKAYYLRDRPREEFMTR